MDFGNQIWKFMSRYFSNFFCHFPLYSTFFGLWIFHPIKIGLLLKIFRTTGLVYMKRGVISFFCMMRFWKCERNVCIKIVFYKDAVGNYGSAKNALPCPQRPPPEHWRHYYYNLLKNTSERVANNRWFW